MYVQHYAGYIPEDKLEKTNDFFELGLKCNYDFILKKKQKFSAYIGVKNLFNEYQSDFDKGINRDASYVYGPQQPRTLYAGLKFSLK